MPNPMQYQQTSLLGKLVMKNLWKIVPGLMGSVPVWLLWVRHRLVVRGKPTSPCCRQLRLPLHRKAFWNQHHFAVTRRICQSKHILKPKPPFIYYCWLRPSCCLQLCLTVSKNVLLLTKYWEYLPSAQIMSLVFCKYLQIQKKLFTVHDDSFIFGAVSTENTY